MKKLLLFFLLMVISVDSFSGVDEATYIPPRAFIYKETIRREIDTYFPEIPTYSYVPALIEHESCQHLLHKRCWAPDSELLSAREQGVGLLMITRTFNPDGSTRFDVLSDLKAKYRDELKELSWGNVRLRPDLQIRSGILLLRDNYRRITFTDDPYVRLHFTDAAYNTGLGNVNKKRRFCGLRADCNPNLWFNHVENECAGLTKPLYGNRSACDIVKHHARDVIFNNLPKYKKYYFSEN